MGIVLTFVWYLNNQKTRCYARFWLGAVERIESKLIAHTGEQDIGFATQITNRPRTDLISHPVLVQTVPILFLIAWLTLLFFGLCSGMLKSGAMQPPLRYELISVVVASASLVISVASVLIAKSSLTQAKDVAERDRRDWRQRKWADMYLKANETYDLLDRFQVLSGSWDTTEWEREWSDLMRVIRTSHAMAVVFPRNPAIDSFLSATAVFGTERTVSKERLTEVLDSVELIRQRARLPADILE